MESKLKEYGLHLVENDDPGRMRVDFSLADNDDNVCWVWGDKPGDVDWECNHPAVEFGDDDEQGVCPICGSFCDWHYEEDDQGNKIRTPHEWYPRRNIGGVVGEYLKELANEQPRTY